MQGIGVYGIAWFRKKGGNANDWPNALPGRSAKACYNKALRLFGTGGLSRGSYSIEEIITRTGYSKTQIRRAMKALAQKWKRLSPGGSYLIYEDQYDDIVNWLIKDYWSKMHRLYKCLWCHGTKYAHKSKGLCLKCYRRYFQQLKRSGHTPNNKLLTEYLKVNHPDYEGLKKAVNQLSRGRALPEEAIQCLLSG